MTAPMATQPTTVAPELVERMVALIRDLRADHIKYAMHDIQQDFVARTAAIVDELPEPVDPDLIEARKICETADLHWDTNPGAENKPFCALGLVLRGVKRGREIAAREQGK